MGESDGAALASVRGNTGDARASRYRGQSAVAETESHSESSARRSQLNASLLSSLDARGIPGVAAIQSATTDDCLALAASEDDARIDDWVEEGGALRG